MASLPGADALVLPFGVKSSGVPAAVEKSETACRLYDATLAEAGLKEDTALRWRAADYLLDDLAAFDWDGLVG